MPSAWRWLALAVAVLASALAGLIGGFIAVRSKGVYFALISFGLAQVVSKIVSARTNWARRTA